MKYSLFPTYKKLCLTCKINFKYVLFNVFNQKKLETISLFEIKFVKYEMNLAVKPIFLIEHENKYFAFFYKLDLKQFPNYNDLINSVNLIELNEKELKNMKDKIIKHDTNLEKFIKNIKAEYFSKRIFNQNYLEKLDQVNQSHIEEQYHNKKNWLTLSLLILFIFLFLSSTGLTIYAFTNQKEIPTLPWGVPSNIEDRLESKDLGKQRQTNDVELALLTELYSKGYSEEQLVTNWNYEEQKITVKGNEDNGFSGEVTYSYSLWKDLNESLKDTTIEGYYYQNEIDNLIALDIDNVGLSSEEVIYDRYTKNQITIMGNEEKEVLGKITYKYTLWVDIRSLSGITTIQRGSSLEEIITKIEAEYLAKGAKVIIGEPITGGQADYLQVKGDSDYGFIGSQNIIYYIE